MKEWNPGERVKILGVEMKKLEDFRYLVSIVQSRKCGSKLRWVDKSVRKSFRIEGNDIKGGC